MSTSIDIKSPVKAAVKVKRETLGVWIEIPCVDKVGTCTYDDLCVHSIPANRTCPKTFTDNDVPCRCPIPKGTYTIDPSIELQVEMYNYFSAYSGKYWAHLSLSEEGVNLITCYEVNFVIEDHKPKTINDIPFVELI
ncbi:hypothetical protein NQ314_011791 [Rhamnusium bicolor]|uniref:MD-2-related lipid-recognition domain-containing protein n=1 Tax=Rhamnusium bicolor TaxID=1586634 RepID=A0AAV8XFM1_9CUCU|nr:hypothetical protein NQ314_011791 [Rhamnusium bicolor]